MKVEVAIGEIFDKITILDIKLARIQDNERLMYVRGERETLDMALIMKVSLLIQNSTKNSKTLIQKSGILKQGLEKKKQRKNLIMSSLSLLD